MMNHFTEGNNRSHNFIAPLGTGLFYTHTFVFLQQIFTLLIETGKTNVSQYRNLLKFVVKRFGV